MDLSTRYLGFDLEHPLVPSASPLSADLDGLKRLEDAGAPMVILQSLFEEEIEHETQATEHFISYGSDTFAEALTYVPSVEGLLTQDLDNYLELIRKARQSLSVPVVASLNGVHDGGWVKSARLMEEAGASALELNVYYLATDMNETAEHVEARYLQTLKTVRASVTCPIAMKLSPFFSAFAHMARELVTAGANSLVLFNRFYQPDIDLDALELYPHLVLSNSNDLRLPLRWISILSGRLDCDLAATSGIHTYQDAAKAIMAGACVTHLCSVLLLHGPGKIGQIKSDLARWLEEKEYHSLRQMLGSMSQANCPDPAAVERANYMKALRSFKPPA